MGRRIESLMNNVRQIHRFVRVSGVRPVRFAGSTILNFVSSLLEGISIGLIIPLLDIIMRRGETPLLAQISPLNAMIGLLPERRLKYVFFTVLGCLFGAIAIKHFFIYYSDLLVSKISRAAEQSLRVKIFNGYLGYSKIAFDRARIGHLTDLATSQVIYACDVFRYGHNFLLYGFMLTVHLMIMCVISWKLTLVSFLFIPFIYLALRMIAQKIKFSTQFKFKADQELNAYLHDSLSNMALIHSYTNEAAESRRYESMSEKSRQSLHSIWKKILFAPHIQEVILAFTISVLISVCVFIFLRGSAALGFSSFLTFFVFLRRFSTSVTACGTCVAEISKSFEPMGRILQMLENQEAYSIKNGATPFSGLESDIEFRNVSFAYEETRILDSVSVTFEKNKMTAILGPTGSGKTTLIHLIPRFYDPTGGTIRLNGRPLQEYDLRSLRRKIALVSQDTQIFNTSIRENIVYGLETHVSQEALDNVVKKSYLYDFIMSLPARYETLVGESGVRLSGGEKQRLAIARALLKNPDVFVFDEATSSLDMETELSIQRSVDELTKGKTVIVIAHRLSTIRNADTLVVLEKGKVTEQGKFSDLVRKEGRFRHYWSFQNID
ncbi:MAG: ABC transporter ATP-binding protein [Candidatus Omnitrophica bacterium]|nr:ABC transporter ATP-binding protein [Candidatus Omnitrophota bacterium]